MPATKEVLKKRSKRKDNVSPLNESKSARNDSNMRSRGSQMRKSTKKTESNEYLNTNNSKQSIGEKKVPTDNTQPTNTQIFVNNVTISTHVYNNNNKEATQ